MRGKKEKIFHQAEEREKNFHNSLLSLVVTGSSEMLEDDDVKQVCDSSNHWQILISLEAVQNDSILEHTQTKTNRVVR